MAARPNEDNPFAPSGKLVVVNIATRSVVTEMDLGGQPDSVAISPDGRYAAIAIENERDEEVNDGALPQMPAGDLVIISLKDGVADCGSMKRVVLSRDQSEVARRLKEEQWSGFNGGAGVSSKLTKAQMLDRQMSVEMNMLGWKVL